MNDNTSAGQELPSLDFHTLRREGIRLIEQLGSKFWTDYNSHDPGITILEQLCYALTDLLYRIDYPVQDLLAEGGSDPFASLFSPAKILPSSPVTLLDLRKFILDIDGVRNAWIERFTPELNDNEPALYFNRKEKTLTLSNGGQAEPLIIKGLYQVWIEPEAKLEEDEAKLDELKNDVREYLHGCRSLCDDFTVTVLRESGENHIEKIGVAASIEIDAAADKAEVEKAVFQQIEDYFSPPVRFYSLKERLESIKYIDEIFEGPLLTKGFIENEELKKNVRRTELRTSDLIRLFMDIKGVLAVQNISFNTKNVKDEKWLLKLEKGIIPRLNKENQDKDQIPKTDIKLIQGGNEIHPSAIKDAAALSLPPGIDEPPRPASQDRHVNGNYFSIQHQFPDCYGINSRGLPGSASSLRKAKAKQLKAYLTLFDQLLANEFAQLANVGRLFSFTDENTDVPAEDADVLPSTYFFDHELRFDAKDNEKELERKSRFLNHLSARFAEQLADQTSSTENGSNEIKRKQEWLRNYPELSRNRAVSYYKLADAEHCTGLERRIRLKFGIDYSEPFYIIEHILLRPIKQDKDNSSSTAILANTKSDDNDPYSLQVTVVHSEKYLSLRSRIREEIPAHISVNFYPYSEEKNEQWWEDFQIICEACQCWRQAMMHYMIHDDSTNGQKLRDTRDSLIDLSKIGKTYPLSDLEVKLKEKDNMVAHNESATIYIPFSQLDVTYQLFHENGKDEIQNDGKSITVPGNGGEVFLKTPPITKNVNYRIMACKGRDDDSCKRTIYRTLLQQPAVINVGVNTRLKAEILLHEPGDGDKMLEAVTLLVPSDQDSPTAARLIHYNQRVQVKIYNSQDGVIYRLFPAAAKNGENPPDASQALSEEKSGNGDIIFLKSEFIKEDTRLCIWARKEGFEETWLKTELPLMVYADATTPKVSPISELILALDASSGIQIENTQISSFYQAFQRQLRDDDFIFKDGDDILETISVTDYPDVQVKKPTWEPVWEQNSYGEIGNGKHGNKGELVKLEFPEKSLKDDSLIIVQAKKQHKLAGKDVFWSVQLQQAVAFLVEPNRESALQLQIHVDGNIAHSLQVASGEIGVFYHFSLEADGKEICLPAYFHQWADGEHPNKGIGKLRIGGIDIGGDFVISAAENPQFLVLEFYEPIDLLRLPDNTNLYIRARKARTNVWINMDPKSLKDIIPPV